MICKRSVSVVGRDLPVWPVVHEVGFDPKLFLNTLLYVLENKTNPQNSFLGENKIQRAQVQRERESKPPKFISCKDAPLQLFTKAIKTMTIKERWCARSEKTARGKESKCSP